MRTGTREGTLRAAYPECLKTVSGARREKKTIDGAPVMFADKALRHRIPNILAVRWPFVQVAFYLIVLPYPLLKVFPSLTKIAEVKAEGCILD